jgi:PAS domain S-box-containing protein
MASEPFPRAWLVLALFTLMSGWATVRMPGTPMSMSLSDTFIMTAALLFGPAAGAMLAGADGLVMSLRLPRESRTPTRVLFNISAAAVSMWLAGTLFFWLATPPATIRRIVVPLTLFGGAYFLLNTGLVAGALAIGRRLQVRHVWREHFFPLWLTYCVATSFAGLLLILSESGLATLQTLLIALPAILIAGLGLKQGADHLRERSEKHATLRSYEAALRSTADAVLLTNADERVTFMNAAAERLTGLTEKAARGRPVAEVLRLHQSDTERINLTNVGEGMLGEYTLIRADGTSCAVEEMHASIRDEDDRVGGVVRTFRDITRRREGEQERRALLLREQSARAAADSANRAKDDFLATLSHELRTPAAAMIGWTELLKGGRLDSERTKKAIGALERSARTQAAVLNDLLDVSRVVRGVMRLHVRRTNLPDIISEAIDTIEPAVLTKRLQLKLTIAPDVSIVDADPDRLRQILWNLLSNAVKFTDSGGLVTTAIRGDDRGVQLIVTDTGQGIPREFLPQVFERFKQADSSSARRHGGLGLGLALVRELVELHGGIVSADSQGPGHGSSFVVQLPAAEHVRLPSNAPVSVATTSLAGTHVLIVEDDDDGREIIVQALEDAGATVSAVSGARDALALLCGAEATTIQVLVTDIGMPEEDGYTLLRELRQLPVDQGGDLPAIAVTSYATVEDRRRALKAGFVAHIGKPFSPMTLVATIARAVAGRART